MMNKNNINRRWILIVAPGYLYLKQKNYIFYLSQSSREAQGVVHFQPIACLSKHL